MLRERKTQRYYCNDCKRSFTARYKNKYSHYSLDFKHEAIKHFKDKHGNDKKLNTIKRDYTIRPDIAIQELQDKNIKDNYEFLYKLFSPIVHGQDFSSFIYNEKQPGTFQLQMDPSENDIKNIFYKAIEFMLYNMLEMDKFFKFNYINSLADLGKKLQGLKRNYCKV